MYVLLQYSAYMYSEYHLLTGHCCLGFFWQNHVGEELFWITLEMSTRIPTASPWQLLHVTTVLLQQIHLLNNPTKQPTSRSYLMQSVTCQIMESKRLFCCNSVVYTFTKTFLLITDLPVDMWYIKQEVTISNFIRQRPWKRKRLWWRLLGLSDMFSYRWWTAAVDLHHQSWHRSLLSSDCSHFSNYRIWNASGKSGTRVEGKIHNHLHKWVISQKEAYSWWK